MKQIKFTRNGRYPVSYVREIREHCDRIGVRAPASFWCAGMEELAAATKLPAAQLAVLTAVNAADDMMKSRDEIRRLQAELDELRDRMERPAAEPDGAEA